MKKINEELIQKHAADLEQICKQRRLWLYASSVVYVSIICIIILWDYIDSFHSKTLWWGIISISLIISVNWWYWTMHSLDKLVDSIRSEFTLIREISSDLTELRNIIKFKKK